jgi:alkylation response protein AidB-like acyl-CoA dehydrogenase
MVEELAYGDCAIANQVGGISFPYVAKLLQFGTDKQKEKFLRPVVEGKYYVALLLTEPHAGSDLSSLRTRAVRKGDRWIINGHKVFITGGSSAGQRFCWLTPIRIWERMGSQLFWSGPTFPAIPSFVGKRSSGIG